MKFVNTTISKSRTYNNLYIPVKTSVGASPMKSELRLPTPVLLSAAPPTKARVTMETHQVMHTVSRATTSLSTSCSGKQNMLSAHTSRYAIYNM